MHHEKQDCNVWANVLTHLNVMLCGLLCCIWAFTTSSMCEVTSFKSSSTRTLNATKDRLFCNETNTPGLVFYILFTYILLKMFREPWWIETNGQVGLLYLKMRTRELWTCCSLTVFQQRKKTVIFIAWSKKRFYHFSNCRMHRKLYFNN